MQSPSKHPLRVGVAALSRASRSGLLIVVLAGLLPSPLVRTATADPSDPSLLETAAPDRELPLPAPFVREHGERRLPDFVFTERLEDGSSQELGFVDLRGRPIVAVSWATWCGVCAKDLPKLDALRSRLAEKAAANAKGATATRRKEPALVAAMSIDDVSPAKVESHLEKRGLGKLRSFYDSDKMFFLTTSGVGVPSAVIADAEGRIVARAQGSVDWQDPDVLAFIESLSE